MNGLRMSVYENIDVPFIVLCKGGFPCRPLAHSVLENSGPEVLACTSARVVIQPHFAGNTQECGGPWIHAVRFFHAPTKESLTCRLRSPKF